MKKIEFLEHTADVKYIARGHNLEDAFSNAAIGFYQVMTDLKNVKVRDEITIKITSNTLESLLYDFISELIFYLDVEGFIGKEVIFLKIEKNEKFSLNTTIAGMKVTNINEVDVTSYVKSMTYSEMIIDTNKNELQIVLDI